MIYKFIADHLNAAVSYKFQSKDAIRIVREKVRCSLPPYTHQLKPSIKAVKRLPELAAYEDAWPVDDALRMRLKYTSSRARKHAREAVGGKSNRKGKRRV